MMSLSQLQADFTRDICELILRLTPAGYRLRLRDVHRSLTEQKRQIAAGNSWIKNPETAPHVESRAADLVLDERQTNGSWKYIADGDHTIYRKLGHAWEALSPFNRWGGRYGDGNHFERLKNARSESELTA